MVLVPRPLSTAAYGQPNFTVNRYEQGEDVACANSVAVIFMKDPRRPAVIGPHGEGVGKRETSRGPGR